MIERLLPFQSAAYTADQDAQSKFTGAAFRGLELLFSGTLSAAQSGSPTLADEVPWPIIGPLELVVGGQSRFRVEAASLFHLSAIYQGGYHHRDVPAATVAGDFASAFALDFHQMMDGAGLDAVGVDAFLRWRPRGGGYWGSGGTGSYTVGSATVRPYAISVGRKPPQGFREPEWQQATHDVSTSSNNIQKVIDFKKAVDLPGLLIEAMDANGGGGTDASAGKDGLIKFVTIEVNQPGDASTKLYDSVSWRALRNRTCRLARFSDDDKTSSVGVVFVPLIDRKGGARRDSLHLKAGSSITITYDTASTVEAGYTGVTPAAGDVARVLAPAFLAIPDQAAEAAATVNERQRSRLAISARRRGADVSRARVF